LGLWRWIHDPGWNGGLRFAGLAGELRVPAALGGSFLIGVYQRLSAANLFFKSLVGY
jgi:hypothetical protein